MTIKQFRKALEKFDDALDDMEYELSSVTEERDDYSFQLEEKTNQIELMELELQLLCKLIFDAHVEIPLSDHFIDINPYVPKTDPMRGNYGCEY